MSDAPRELTLTIPANLWMSANVKRHWADTAKRVRGVRALGKIHGLRTDLRDLGPTHVVALIGYPPKANRADPANERVSKHLIDGMVDAGVWPDDSSEWVIGPDPRRGETSGQPGVHTVRLVLTPQPIPFSLEAP